MAELPQNIFRAVARFFVTAAGSGRGGTIASAQDTSPSDPGLLGQRVRVKGNLFAPKCSYANIPYVKCSETRFISGCCVFLLPLPFELKFWFFEFEYVT